MERQVLLGQIVRFGVMGLALTVLSAGGYWAIADLLHVDPYVSLTLVYAVVTAIGFVSHSKYSFKGHGARDRVHVRSFRFFVTNGLGFIANQFFVWLLVKHLGGPTWWSVIPMIIITPVLTFSLNRHWVFAD